MSNTASKDVIGELEVLGTIESDGVDKLNIDTVESSAPSNRSVLLVDNGIGKRSLYLGNNLYYNPSSKILSCDVNTSSVASSSQTAQVCSDASYGGFATYAAHTGYTPSVTNATYANNAYTATYANSPEPTLKGDVQINGWNRFQGNATFRLGGSSIWMQDSTYLRTAHDWIAATEGLELVAYGWQENPPDADHDWWQNGGNFVADNPDANFYWLYYGFKTNKMVAASGYSAVSDRRIKQDIEDLDDLEALETIRALKPCKYDYKNKKTDRKQIGFIAQEVKEVIPDAIHYVRDIIPSFNHTGNIYITNDTFNLILDVKPEVEIQEKDVLAIMLPLQNSKRGITRVDANVISVVNNINCVITSDDLKHRLSDSSEFNLVIEDNTIPAIVVGKYVDDFHVLDKDKIWAVGIAAQQQIDRELISKKPQLDSLKIISDAARQNVLNIQDQVNYALVKLTELENK